MVNAFGYYASAKGMVLVPNLSELTSAAAISELESEGLNYSLGADVDTTNAALDNLVAAQDPAANTLVDYETVVQFSLYNLVSVPPFFPPFFPFFPFFPSFPSTPSVSVSATAISDTQINVSWSFTNFTAQSFQITRTGAPPSPNVYPLVNSTDTTFTNLGLTCNSTYTYDIIFYSGLDGTGTQLSGSATATTSACAAIFAITSTSSGPTSITYSWANPPAGTTSYSVFYATEDVPSTPVSTTSTTYTFESLTPNTTYQVYTQARNSGGTLLATASASVSTQPVSSPFFPPFFPPSFPFFPPFFPPSFPSFPDFPPSFPPEFGSTTYYGCCGDATSVTGTYASLSAATTAMEQFCATETMTPLVSGPSTSPISCLCGGLPEPYPGQCFCSGGVWIC
jgi:hypothetical protein